VTRVMTKVVTFMVTQYPHSVTMCHQKCHYTSDIFMVWYVICGVF
jgi:hypothetical protein